MKSKAAWLSHHEPNTPLNIEVFDKPNEQSKLAYTLSWHEK